MYKIIGIILVFVVLIGIIFIPKNSPQTSGYSLEVNNKNINLLIADTDALRVQGLSAKDSLPKDTAMLFIFDTSDTYGFWMKDMKFSIDILWLDEKGKIISIEKNLAPESYPHIFIPPQKSLYVLEGNAGFSDENNLMVGNILNMVKK